MQIAWGGIPGINVHIKSRDLEHQVSTQRSVALGGGES